MRDKIYLIGCPRFSTELLAKIAAQHPEIIIVSDTKQSYRTPFESESIPIHNLINDSFDPLIDKHYFYENEPSKFIGKPKNNFKKR